MTSKGFLCRLAMVVAGVGGAAVACNMWIDLYGLFRDHGAGLKVYGEERICKYLFSYRYIPDHFDALLLGSSASDNMPIRNVAGHKVYNASLNGGNITEVKDLGLNALAHGHFKLVLLGINRYMMQNSGHKTNFMVGERYWGALASLQLYTAYTGRFLDQAGIRKAAYDVYGTVKYGETRPAREEIERFASRLRRGERTNWVFEVDPQAYKDLAELTRNIHERGADLVVFFPPLPTLIQEAIPNELAALNATITSALGPNTIVIDCNTPEYRPISDDTASFRDFSHLSDAGAVRAAEKLAKEMTEKLAAAGRSRVARLDRTYE